jgi:hypothetical protein
MWQARQKRRHARHVAIVFSALISRSKHHFFDIIGT